ncbi:transposase [Dictyobacter sp. S3.2.2.5]|uniref:Transposase n=2 Tax=Dictyobacter halimunensis TaxID=3026934 RepID=A0ABQ6FKQ2_9CHLR|nr:transposase [Dictyobacter sp. S3.2.2.5]
MLYTEATIRQEKEQNRMIRAHKIRLHPTSEQATYLARAAGVARFVWNWALAEWNRHYEAGEKPSALTLKKQFNAIRRQEFPWTWEVTKNASDQPFLDLGKAWTAYFDGLREGRNVGKPRFKRKKRSKPSFYLANDQLELGDHRVWIPKLGWVNLAENLRWRGKMTGARVTKTADWWFLSVTVELPDEPADPKIPAIGIDVGLNRLVTLSTGENVENQAFLKTSLKKLRRANKRLHRRNLGSKNREKARRQLARVHYRITCQRDDLLQKLTTQIAACYGMVAVEDLHLKGLLKNRCLARSFSDAALGKLLRLLSSKVEHQGGRVITVDRFFPSSKTCHACTWKWEDMQLSDRLFVCQNEACAYYHVAQDRDHNAAQNLLQEVLRLVGWEDQAVTGIGSDTDVNLAVDLM